ncbi:MAG: hypothetical protein BM557_06355 [Flavobacterium sp. MedPE-SWcel]|uniref:hypothetical protein n=1 Tax=uncultured Flavobacterium sp. TaxID=165435 RepID=UPI00091A6FA9|nr:hypothetical protein [uncultured Flavobacterium sp.]OIQ19321.1 MAG: hypothetical protein BM557_06355 [Flavobacterium sp. MedPE-SWcel]
MCNKQQVQQEIIDLEQVKWAYIHFLSSPKAKVNVENYTQIENNKIIVKQTLRQLYQDLQQLKDNKTINNKSKTITYQYTKDEENAIIHFNNNKRFSITE